MVEGWKNHDTGWSQPLRAIALTLAPAGVVSLIGSLVGVAVLIKGGNVVGLIIVLALITVLFPALRGIIGRISLSESAKLGSVVDELARLAGESGE